MPYEQFGRIHHHLSSLMSRAACQRGQGTVEYVGLILLLATLLTGVVVAAGKVPGKGIADEIAGKLKETISEVGDAKAK